MTSKQLIEKLSKYFGTEFHEEFEGIGMEGQEFIIKLDNEEQLLSIYKIFPVLVGQDNKSDFGLLVEELMLVQSLYLKSNKIPETRYEISMGCPYDYMQVGFFDCQIVDEGIYDIVDIFVATEDVNVDLDFMLLHNICPEKVEDYIERLKQENDKLSYLINDEWKVYETRCIEEVGKVSDIFINCAGNVMVGIDEFSYNKIISKMKINKIDKVFPYEGIKYVISKNENSFTVWNLNYINEIYNQLTRINLYAYDIEYYVTDRGLLIVRCLHYWAFVAPINTDVEKIILQERKCLRNMLEKLEEYMPVRLGQQDEIDFSQISAAEFEKLCKEILSELGFKNIFSRGNTNTSDGGVDIECDEEINQIFGKKQNIGYLNANIQSHR